MVSLVARARARSRRSIIELKAGSSPSALTRGYPLGRSIIELKAHASMFRKPDHSSELEDLL